MKLSTITRKFWRLIYQVIASKLPGSKYGSSISSWTSSARVFCVRRFIKTCGNNLKIGPNVVLSSLSQIGHYVTINENCLLPGCVIHDYALIAPECYSIGRNHHYEDPNTPVVLQGYTNYTPPEIGRDVWVGVRVTLLPGIKLGEGCIVAAGAVVTKDVAPFTVVAGIPARVIAHRGEQPHKMEQSKKS